MSKKSPDLHGNAPDKSAVALLLLDVINDMEFEGGELLAQHALPAAQKIKELKQRAKPAGIPAIYVNDNFGKWRSDFKKLVAHVIDDQTRGQPIAELLRPEDDDYFVLKPKHSGLLFNQPGSSFAPPRFRNTDPRRLGRRHLHPLHRRRCAHA